MGIAKVAPAGRVDPAPAVPLETAPSAESDEVIELDPAAIAAIAPVAGSKASMATLSQACMPGVSEVVLASAEDFRADPQLWVESRSDAPRRLLRDVRSIAISDPQVVTMFEPDMLKDMEPGTRHAIGIGIGRAARTCVRVDPEIMDIVERTVLDTKDNSFVEGYLLEVSRSVRVSDSIDVESPEGVAVREVATQERPRPVRQTARLNAPEPQQTQRESAPRRAIDVLAASETILGVDTDDGSNVDIPGVEIAGVVAPSEVKLEVEDGAVRLDLPFIEEFEQDEVVSVRAVSSVSPTQP